jgi:hypothetical protein
LDVNECEGYLLWLASHHDNADLFSGLHKLGAQLHTESTRTSAIYQAIEYDRKNLLRRFLQLFCRVKANDLLPDQETPNFLRNSQPYLPDLSDCRRVMRSIGVYTELVSMPSPLTFAYMYGSNDTVALLLRTYPAWEHLSVSNGLTLVEAAWRNDLECIKTILSREFTQGDHINGGDLSGRRLFAALLASVHKGNCDLVDMFLEAGATPGLPARASPVGRTRIQLRTVSVVVSPLHVALDLFRSREVQVSRRIVQSLIAHGAILYSQVKDTLPEWVDMGHLEDEDCTWLGELFPTPVDGPLRILSSQVHEPITAQESRFLWQCDDSDEAYASDDFSNGSSSSDSTCSFVSAEETQGE